MKVTADFSGETCLHQQLLKATELFGGLCPPSLRASPLRMELYVPDEMGEERVRQALKALDPGVTISIDGGALPVRNGEKA